MKKENRDLVASAGDLCEELRENGETASDAGMQRTTSRTFLAGGTLLCGLYGYVPLNRVWFSGSRVLNRVYKFTSVLNRVSFWTESL